MSPIADYLQWLGGGGRSAGTLRLRRYQLWRLARTLSDVSPWRVTSQQLSGYLADDTWEPETRRSNRTSIASFYNWAAMTGRVAASPAEQLAAVTVPVGKPRPTPDAVLASAMARSTERVQLMLMLAAYAGLRRAEISRVSSHDVIDGQLRVVGKGGKVRMVPLHPVLLEAIEVRPAGLLFPGGVDGHLGADYVGKLVARALGNGWTAHTLRHRFSTRAYAGDRDLFAVQELLGHSSSETTKRYVLLPPDALTRAVLAAGPATAAILAATSALAS